MPERDLAMSLRGLALRGVVESTDDAGETQTASVTTLKDVRRSDVEVLQPFGFASRAPAGGLALVIGVGADQGDVVMLPVGSPAHRFGGLAEGEAVLYTAEGDHFLLRADGTAALKTSKAFEAEFAGDGKLFMDATTFRVEVAGHVLELGPAGLKHNGKNIGDTHVHGEVVKGNDLTDVPAN